LFSPSSVGCSTNLVVLTHSAVTARGCAAYSVIAHVGVGLIVAGAVLLLGSFALAVRSRRYAATPSGTSGVLSGDSTGTAVAAETMGAPASTVPTAPTPPMVQAVEVRESVAVPRRDPEPAVTDAPVAARPVPPDEETAVVESRPIAPGEESADHVAGAGDESALLGSVVRLPPGWYGNPGNPGGAVQWWDGTKLTDGPG
jgi:hypothetical protein